MMNPPGLQALFLIITDVIVNSLVTNVLAVVAVQ